MQRIRIGLTGLAFVFLAVLLATALTRDPAGEAPLTPNLIEQQRAGPEASPAPEEPAGSTEPLAELGVAPGNADANVAAEAAPPVAQPEAR